MKDHYSLYKNEDVIQRKSYYYYLYVNIVNMAHSHNIVYYNKRSIIPNTLITLT